MCSTSASAMPNGCICVCEQGLHGGRAGQRRPGNDRVRTNGSLQQASSNLLLIIFAFRAQADRLHSGRGVCRQQRGCVWQLKMASMACCLLPTIQVQWACPGLPHAAALLKAKQHRNGEDSRGPVRAWGAPVARWPARTAAVAGRRSCGATAAGRGALAGSAESRAPLQATLCQQQVPLPCQGSVVGRQGSRRRGSRAACNQHWRFAMAAVSLGVHSGRGASVGSAFSAPPRALSEAGSNPAARQIQPPVARTGDRGH